MSDFRCGTDSVAAFGEGEDVSERSRRLPDEGCRWPRDLRRQGEKSAQPSSSVLQPSPLRNIARKELVKHIADIDFIETDRVDALLKEARLVKDIQPRFNPDPDDKTFPTCNPYREEFPACRIHRKPRRKGVKLAAHSPAARVCAGVQAQPRLSVPHALDTRATTTAGSWFRPCLLHSIRQCTAPRNFRVTRGVPQANPLVAGWSSKASASADPMEKEMWTRLQFEKAAKPGEIASLQSSSFAAASMAMPSGRFSTSTAQWPDRPAKDFPAPSYHRRRGHRSSG